MYTGSDAAIRELGEDIARKYVGRLNIIRHALDFEELKGMPGLNCHELKGKLRHKWAIKLTERMRLIVSVDRDNNEVRIEEISKHYGD